MTMVSGEYDHEVPDRTTPFLLCTITAPAPPGTNDHHGAAENQHKLEKGRRLPTVAVTTHRSEPQQRAPISRRRPSEAEERREGRTRRRAVVKEDEKPKATNKEWTKHKRTNQKNQPENKE